VTCVADGSVDTPRQLVIQVSNQVIQALNEDPELEQRDPNSIYKLLNRIVVPHFDFDAIARLVLGKYWRDANSEQRQRFIKEFRTYLVRFYAVSLAKYKHQRIEYKPVRADATGNEVEVRTEVQQQEGPPIPIDYRLRLKGSEWKVYDVTIDGVSLVVSNRSSFAAEIRQGGIDVLTARLAKKNRQSGD